MKRQKGLVMSRARNTFLNECRKFFPKCSASDASHLIWNCTAFPFAPIEHCRKQLKEISQRSNRNVNAAMAIAQSDMEKACELRTT